MHCGNLSVLAEQLPDVLPGSAAQWNTAACVDDRCHSLHGNWIREGDLNPSAILHPKPSSPLRRGSARYPQIAQHVRQQHTRIHCLQTYFHLEQSECRICGIWGYTKTGNPKKKLTPKDPKKGTPIFVNPPHHSANAPPGRCRDALQSQVRWRASAGSASNSPWLRKTQIIRSISCMSVLKLRITIDILHVPPKCVYNIYDIHKHDLCMTCTHTCMYVCMYVCMYFFFRSHTVNRLYVNFKTRRWRSKKAAYPLQTL